MIFFFIFVKCTEYYIKIPKTNLYLQGPVGGINASVFFHDKSNRNRFKVTLEDARTQRYSIKVIDVPNNFLDVSKSENILIYYPLSASTVQTYELRPEKGLYNFRIASGKLCATWNPTKKIVINENCSENGLNQIFTFICANCYKKTNGEIAVGRAKYYELDRTNEGFFDNNVITLLHSIENMSHEFTDCFAANAICAKQVENHPLLSFSPFSDLPLISGDWSLLQDNSIDYNVKIGDKNKSGNIKLDSKKVEDILNNDSNKTCFDPSENINCKEKNNIHGKDNAFVKSNLSKYYDAKQQIQENYMKKYNEELKELQNAIKKFKSSVEHASSYDHSIENKLSQLMKMSQEKHMLPQYSDIRIHDSLHQDGDADHEKDKDLQKYIDEILNNKNADKLQKTMMEDVKTEENLATKAIFDANKSQIEKIKALQDDFLPHQSADDICRMMYTDEYCNQLQQILLTNEM